MKKSKLITLPLIALALIGCSRTNDSTTPTSTTPQTTEKTTTSTTASSEATTSSTTSSETTSSQDSTSVDSTTSDDSTSSSTDIYAGWSTSLIDLMNKHLGGNILPFVNLGSQAFGSWEADSSNFGVLTIETSKNWDDTTSYNEFQTAFTAGEYTIDIDSKASSIKLTSKDGLIKVSAGRKSSTDSTILVKATYDEPYDKTKALTDWENDIKEAMVDAFGEAIPYIYTGLQYPTLSESYYDNVLYIDGGKWNDSIINDVKESLSTLNATIVEETAGGIVATLKMTTSADSFEITLKQIGSSVKKVRLEIRTIATFDPNSATAWTSDITDVFDDYLDGHSVPFVYLGTTLPDANVNSYSGEIEISGEVWNDSILTTAKDTFDADKSNNASWTTNVSSSEFKASITLADGCEINVRIYHYSRYSDDYPIMEIIFTEGMNVPEGSTWSSETQAEIQKLVNDGATNFTLPYVYLNLKNGAVEDATYDSTTKELRINGGKYISKIYDNAFETYSALKEADGTASWKIETDSYSPYLTMTHIDEQKNKYVVEIGRDYDDDAGGYIAYLICTFTEKYSVPEDATAYCQDTQDLITKYMHGHDLPYVYLRTTDEYASYDEYYGLEITGGAFDSAMLTEAEKQFKAKNWKTAISGEEFTASKTFNGVGEDSCTITAELNDYYGDAKLTFTLTEGYNKANAQEGWNEDTTDYLETYYEGLTLPYIYLGTSNESVSYRSSTLTITGGAWNKAILADSKTALESAGFTYIGAKFGTADASLFVKEDTENKFFYSIMVMNISSTPYLKLSKESTDDVATSTTQAYSEAIKTGIKTNNGGYEIPFIDLGTDNLDGLYYSNSRYYQISADDEITNYQMYKAYKTFKDNAAYTTQINFTTSDFYFTASTKNSDNSQTIISVKNNWGVSIHVMYSPAFNVPTDVTTWSDTVSELMNQYFDGNIIPYFYLGTAEPEAYYNSNENMIMLSGLTWDDQIFTLCETALNNDATDGKSNWSYMYEYTNMKVLSAVKKIGDNYLTLKLYKSTAENPYPVLEIYYF